MIAQRTQRIGFSPTLAVSDLAARLRAEGRDVLDFSAGQPDFPTPDAVKQAAKLAIDENRTRYTANAGVVELREAVADCLRADRGLDYAADSILISPGGKASLYFAFMALCDAGDEVLIPRPYWTSYPEQVKLTDAKPVFVDCPERDGFKLTPDALDGACTARTRAIVLNYPSNPTGASYDRDELVPLAETCLRRGLWIVADEIYSRLLYDGRTFASVAGLGPGVRKRTIVIDGMSKTYSMTGWRIGYAAGPRDVIAAMSKIQSHVTSNATSISQWASVAALGLDSSELETRRRAFEQRRNELVAGLRSIEGISCVEPQGAFYVFPNVSARFDGASVTCGQDMAKLLLERGGVAVVPGEAFGAPDHVRLSYACSLEQIREGLERIARSVESLPVR